MYHTRLLLYSTFSKIGRDKLLLKVTVQPLLNGARRLYTMFPDFKQYPYVLPGHRYKNLADLQATMEEKIIKPAEEKAKELDLQYPIGQSVEK